MTERPRRSWFLIAAAVVVGAVVLMSWVAPDPQAPDEQIRASSPSDGAEPRPRRAIIQGAENAPRPSPVATRAPTSEGDAGGPPPRDEPVPRFHAAERDARTFVDAFLHYELGDLPAKVKRAIRSSTTAELGRSLLANPPRVPPSPRNGSRGRLADLSDAEPVDGGRLHIVPSIDRDGRRTSLLLTLERRGKRWLVTDIG